MKIRTYLVRIERPKVYRHKRQPDDAGGIHGETYELGFVEIFWYFPSLYSINCANYDKYHIIYKGNEEFKLLATIHGFPVLFVVLFDIIKDFFPMNIIMYSNAPV